MKRLLWAVRPHLEKKVIPPKIYAVIPRWSWVQKALTSLHLQVRQTLVCQECGATFIETARLGSGLFYCTKTCRNRARNHRRAAKKRVEGASQQAEIIPEPVVEPVVEPVKTQVLCPRPDKRIYLTKADAQERIACSWTVNSGPRAGQTNMHAYRCECGFWHIGHRVPRPVRLQEQQDSSLSA